MKVLILFALLLCCTAALAAQPSLSKRIDGYVFGPDDLIAVRVLEIEEFNTAESRRDPRGPAGQHPAAAGWSYPCGGT